MAHDEEEPFVTDRFAAAASRESAAVRANFGRALRQARRASGMSHAEIEARTGVPESELSDIEAGRTDPALATMVALAKALHEDLWALLA